MTASFPSSTLHSDKMYMWFYKLTCSVTIIYTKTAKLWKKCAAQNSKGEKRCEIKEGGSQKSTDDSSIAKILIMTIQVRLYVVSLGLGTKFTLIVIINFFCHWTTITDISWQQPLIFTLAFLGHTLFCRWLFLYRCHFF